ncbi:DASH family cryptochrome [Halomonas saccharevitans]|uniref:Cryptochrome DASH n=1 Tax=Halomonas saccharevitans TaxID=416872 RepID=A0A1I6YHI9_9GAMM|nr:DASH family cryptochrome [Halomonas saccharevitans]SFT49973.1 deoxyribodipyrimidine photo-lyase [Halomonas saccharevitans]
MNRTLIWLRGDLRLADNSLFFFATPPEALICVFALDEAWLEPPPGLETPRIGPARLRFLWESLIELRGELLKRGSDLLVRIGDPVQVMAGLIDEYALDEVRVRADPGWEEQQAVAQLATRLGEGVALSCHDTGMLLDEASLPTALDELPGSFSAFRRRVERAWAIPDAAPAPVTLPGWPEGAPRGFPPLGQVCAQAAGWAPDARGEFAFAGGEAAGLARLDHYLWQSGAIARYKQTRNGLVGADFSTRLSPWLAHGCLSARQVRDAVCAWEARHGASESSYWVVFELLWREYFHWAARQEGSALYGDRRLPAPGDGFRTWCEGRTGVPFVDAAMRELSATGWLSNRARQNVASFLINELEGDWRLGAAWFEACLVDYDVASNWGNWRYVAGVGRDTRDRWFNVLKQARDYDPAGNYVAHWQPELAELPPGQARHQPWRVAPRRFASPVVEAAGWRDWLLPQETRDD